MAKDDFDIDFDFEKEYGFDPKAILDSDTDDEDFDLSEFESELGIDLTQESQDGEDYSDFDLDGLDLGEEPLQEEEPEQSEDFDIPMDFSLGRDADFEDEAEEEEPDDKELYFSDDLDEEDDFDDEDLTADMNFSRRKEFFGEPAVSEEPAHEEAEPEEPSFDVPDFETPAFEEPIYEAPAYEETDEDDDDDDDDEDEEEAPKAPRNPRRRKPAKKREPIKLTVPPVLIKLVNLYFPPKDTWEPKPDPNNPRRRRKKSKQQIFKEFYLPPILAGVTLVLVVAFLFGSIGNAIAQRRIKADNASKESQAAAESQDREEQQVQELLEQAALLAAGYDYEGASDLLETFTGDTTKYPDITTKKAEYINAKQNLVEHKDPSIIPNLSFHVLIADPVRAFADEENGGMYNRNFVTIDEFTKILNQLYKNNYVLVDFDSFVSSNTGVDGNESFFVDPILLPEGKKPVMITETLVNYFAYMIDGNGDGEADAGGAGFASRLVVDDNGDIQAEYVDASGQTLTGKYDLVPILEAFIEEHPDFAYRGARATLAVTGREGVFGYRINTSNISTKSQAYYDEQVAGAQKLVTALKEKGYTIACFTYDNIAYRDKTAAQIQADLQQWKDQIASVIGDVDTIVFARTSDIDDYSGAKFKVLYDYGFRYFVKNAESTYGEVNTTYVRQSRLMVTGNSLQWKSSMFSGMFDAASLLDVTNRGDVPN